MTSHDPKLQQQIELEIDMVGLGGDRFRSRSLKAIDAGRGTATKPGTYLVKKVPKTIFEM
jgi:DNA-directed RNA polymerase